MLTTKQFDSLKVGDVLLYHGKPRTVRSVTRQRTACGVRRSITFSILKRSWTGRIQTVRGYHDIKHQCSLPRKEQDRSEVCKAEEAALLASRFNVLAQVERELAENERLTKHGMGERREAVTLLKRVRRKLKRRKP